MPRFYLSQQTIPANQTVQIQFDSDVSNWVVQQNGQYNIRVDWTLSRQGGNDPKDLAIELVARLRRTSYIRVQGRIDSGRISNENLVMVAQGDEFHLECTNHSISDSILSEVLWVIEPIDEAIRPNDEELASLIQAEYPQADLSPRGNVRVAKFTDSEGPVIVEWNVTGTPRPNEKDLTDRAAQIRIASEERRRKREEPQAPKESQTSKEPPVDPGGP